MFNKLFFFENRAVEEIMWENTVQPGCPQMAIWCTRIACWKAKATDAHSECVILTALPWQQLLHVRISMLRLHVHRLSSIFQEEADEI